jgi:Protein of unknown function (DUF3108)
MPVRVLLLVVLLLQLAPGPLQVAAAPAPVIRENLEYQISLGPCSDVGRVHLVLKELEPGRYLAEVSWATQGVGKLSSRWLPERYQTEMVHREGRLVPLIYREEFHSKGQRVSKEYRFDYESGRLSLWRRADDGVQVKQWEVPLNGPVYDPLALFYNVRLGTFGPLPRGTTLKVMVLSTLKPQEMVFVVGPSTEMGRNVTMDRRRAGSKAVRNYFCYLSPEQVPTLAWTRLPLFGKLTGRLLNPGEIRKEGLLALRPGSSPSLEAQR